MPSEIHFQIALTLIPQIGDVVARLLVDHFKDASAIFKASRRQLERIPCVGPSRAQAICCFRDYARIDSEILFMERNKIRPLFYTDPDYPSRLQHCWDAPVMLYTRGNANLGAAKLLGVVGTRSPTPYGIGITRDFIRSLAALNVTIVSGMAYGIDITAHETALDAGLPTIGVLAHGLDRLYPASHGRIAHRMLEYGGLATDFPSGTALNRQHFPRRNRIVAGCCDGLLVIESGERGGSLITADLAAGYHRDVMAIPGRIGDETSAGCLALIKQHKAALVETPDDLLDIMNWRAPPSPTRNTGQTALFAELDNKQRDILSALETGRLSIDEIQYRSGIARSQVAGDILQLELLGLVRSMPGNTYQLSQACDVGQT